METYAPPAEAKDGLLADLGLSSRPTDLIDSVKAGVPFATFRVLCETLGISEAALAGVTGISIATLTRRKRATRLAPAESEHVVRIATLLDRAERTFGDIDDAADWLKSPNVSLGERTPLEFADTEIGAREVEHLLGRIQYGVYS